MREFYFIYDKQNTRHPFRAGWSLVIAGDQHKAIKAFQKIHPSKDGERVRCGLILSIKEFACTGFAKYGNNGGYLMETIEAERS